MSKDETTQQAGMPGWSKALMVLGGIGIVVTILWQLLPTGSFPSDLSQIGEGKPALVMMREIHVVGGEQVMDWMLEIHQPYQDDVVFLIAHTGHPDGEAFAAEHNVRDGQLVLFDAQGDVIDVMGRPQSPQELISFVNQALN